MYALMAAALLDTVVMMEAPDLLEVHEWGVVVFQEERVLVTGSPGPDLYLLDFDDPYIDDMPYSVEAPVVYFYGDGFRGDFIVEVPNGEITEIYPEDGVGVGPNSLVWRDIQVTEYDGDLDCPAELPVGFLWEDDVNLWRSAEGNTVRTPGGGEEGFLYYECALRDIASFDYPARFLTDGGLPENVQRVLLFSRPDEEFQEMYSVEPSRIFHPVETEETMVYSRDAVLRELCSWSGSDFYSRELEIMWDTWEPWIISGEWEGDALVVFPLPREAVSDISSLSVSTDDVDQGNILYSRFFLGVLPVTWD